MSEKMTSLYIREKYQSGTVKPDYKDFGISENMYQRKYILKKGEPIPTFGILLISLIPCQIFMYPVLRHLSQRSHESLGFRDKWTSETSFIESLEILWEQYFDLWSIPLYIPVYIITFYLVQGILSKFELTWDNENFSSYEFFLEIWERNTRKKKEEEEKERKREKERLKREKELEEENKKREKERLKREKELEVLRKKQEYWFGLSGRETEVELDKVFEKLGYETVLTKTGSDEGLDHILDREIVVQTKNEITKVSRPDLQRFWGSFKSSHKKGIFVSLHGFTKHCEKFVKDKPILLYDVDDVIGMSEGKKPEWNE